MLDIDMAKAALGKGLGALIQPRAAAPAPIAESGERITPISLDLIVPSPLQPRREFRPEQLSELVESIRERGIIQPLIVRKSGNTFELIAGERRWRAAREVGLKEAPVIVREATDREVLELALIENLQREDLNPIEEATAYARLAREFQLTQEEIAKKVGKSRAAVANSMRLLELEETVRSWLVQGRLTVGHAKALLALRQPEEQRMLAERVIRESASVRATEKLVASFLARTGAPAGGNGKSPRKTESLSPAFQHLQNLLQQRLGTRVIIHHGEKQGNILIEYYGRDDLDRILQELGVSVD